ncbi:general transcription factor 3C polypeptide 6 isoform X2 [Apis laboriosa]|uniref:general transcription factor 3C polypeptide 6 isoform X2 n=1 Tax=Apis laboriosa TaxID=183418 RepID=UPI001CC4709D|nr:general transcription factor 3C polypeptide 6 isoform X2 [Apis laboriosa]
MITMENNDDTSDSEEILVYVEFEVLDDNVFNEKQLQLDMIGIDTEHPIMQINGKFYEGTYEDVVGTYMFFTKTNDSAISDPVFDIAPNFKYFAKTKKFLKMQRIFIKSRTEVLGDSENNQCIPNSYTLKQAGIPLQYRTEEKQRIRQQKKSQGIILESESDEDNPFAMYEHKEESFNLDESKYIHVDSQKELTNSDN